MGRGTEATLERILVNLAPASPLGVLNGKEKTCDICAWLKSQGHAFYLVPQLASSCSMATACTWHPGQEADSAGPCSLGL